MPAPNTPLLSNSFSPRHRALEIKATFSSASLPVLPYKPSTYEHEAGPYNAKQRTNMERKRVSKWKRSQSNALCFLSNPEVTAKYFTSSSFPRVPLSLVVFCCVSTAIKGWIWLTVSLGQYRYAISHCNSKLAERGVKYAKRQYWVATYIFKDNEWDSVKKLTMHFGTAQYWQVFRSLYHIANHASEAGHPQIPSCFQICWL